MNKPLMQAQAEYETSLNKHRSRMEVMAKAHYAALQLRGSKLTYEEILSHLQDNDNSDFGCEPSPIEWQAILNNSKK